jgi:hypothetical protein
MKKSWESQPSVFDECGDPSALNAQLLEIQQFRKTAG